MGVVFADHMYVEKTARQKGRAWAWSEYSYGCRPVNVASDRQLGKNAVYVHVMSKTHILGFGAWHTDKV